MNDHPADKRITSRLDGIVSTRLSRLFRWLCIVIYLMMVSTTIVMAMPFVFSETIDWSRMNVTLMIGTVTILIGVIVHACLSGSVRE